jgi:hypothetical protein
MVGLWLRNLTMAQRFSDACSVKRSSRTGSPLPPRATRRVDGCRGEMWQGGDGVGRC